MSDATISLCGLHCDLADETFLWLFRALLHRIPGHHLKTIRFDLDLVRLLPI